MRKLILFFSVFLFTISSAIASGQIYSVIIDKQAQQIKNLTTRLESLENSVFDIKTQLNSKGSSATITTSLPSAAGPTNGNNTNSAEIEAVQTNTDDGTAVVKGAAISQEKKDYDTALATLKDNKFEEAEALFSLFREKHPNSNLQSNATFWYAETFFRRGIFNKAAINYLKGYKAFPKGNKAADSLLKLSFSLASLNKNEEACSMLAKLELEFPNRPATSVKRARDARSKFRCK